MRKENVQQYLNLCCYAILLWDWLKILFRTLLHTQLVRSPSIYSASLQAAERWYYSKFLVLNDEFRHDKYIPVVFLIARNYQDQFHNDL